LDAGSGSKRQVTNVGRIEGAAEDTKQGHALMIL
jgi:hypothetical protein